MNGLMTDMQAVSGRIADDLVKYEKIILIVDGLIGRQELKDGIKRYLSKNRVRVKTLMLAGDRLDICNENVVFRKISSEEEQQLLNLYSMYEFSDHFVVLDFRAQCGNILNYVENGIMTVDEAMEAWFNF